MEHKELSPEQLAEQCKAGCPASFERLVACFEARILNFLYQITRNRHDAEDLTQETFIKAFRSIHRYEPAYAFATWLYTIAKRTAFSHLRSARPLEEIAPETEANSENPGVLLEQKDEQARLWRLAKKLKPKQYEALWLRYSEGFSIAEIARIMGTTQIHVKVLLHRARAQLADILRRAGEATRN